MASTLSSVVHRTRVRQFLGIAVVASMLIAIQNHPAAQQSTAASAFPKIQLTTGRSLVLPTDFDIVRMAVTNPAIADATVVQQREILIDGKAPGTISLIIWGPDNQRIQYDVVVEQPISNL